MVRRVGDKAVFTQAISPEFIDCASTLCRDFNKAHTGEGFPGRDAFEKRIGTKERIAHGMIIASLVNKPLWEIGGDGVLFGELKTIRFQKPVQVNDVITVEVEVIEEKSGGRLILAVRYRNQHGEDVIAPTEATIFLTSNFAQNAP